MRSSGNVITIYIKFHSTLVSSASGQNQQGITYLNHRRYEEALECFEEVLRQSRNCWEALNNQGFVLTKLERYEEATQSLKQAIRLLPKKIKDDYYHVLLNNLGSTLAVKGNLDRAIENYMKAISFRLTYRQAWLNLSKAYEAKHNRFLQYLCYVAIALIFIYEFLSLLFLGFSGVVGAIYQILSLAFGFISRGIFTSPTSSNLGREEVHYVPPILDSNYGTELDRKELDLDLPAFDSSSKVKELWYEKGLSLIEKGQHLEALTLLNKLVDFKSTNYSAWLNTGSSALKLKSYDIAVISFSQALRINPDNQDAIEGQSLALRKLLNYLEQQSNLGLTGRSVEKYTQYSGIISKFTDETKQPLRFLSFDSSFFYQLATGLIGLNLHLHALASFDQALEIINTLPKIDSTIKRQLSYHNMQYEKGTLLLQQKYYEEAISCFDEALKIEPNYHEAWRDRGVALMSMFKHKEALKSFNRAISIDLNFSTLNQKGLALYELFRVEEAIEVFSSALDTSSRDYIIWFNRGNAFKKTQQYQLAAEDFRKALELSDNNFSLAWNELGWAILYTEGYEKALEHWCNGVKRFLPTEPRSQASIHFLKRSVYGDTSASNLSFESTTKFNELLGKNPKDPQACGLLYQSIASAHKQHGDRQPQDFDKRVYWKKAEISYEFALKYLTAKDFCEQRLEAIKDLVSIYRQLNQINEVRALGIEGYNLLAKLLEQQFSKGRQFHFWIKFSAFHQLRVDQLVQSQNLGDHSKALNYAEWHRNFCLRIINDQGRFRNASSSEDTYSSPLNFELNFDSELAQSSNYFDIRDRLLSDNSRTAIIYWHISPVALTTFVVTAHKPLLVWKYRQSRSIWSFVTQQFLSLISRSEKASRLRGFTYPPATCQLQYLETWIANWKKCYKDYLNQDIKVNHPWTKEMHQSLEQLKEILNISQILKELRNVSNIILIPHRDLHLLPLHALFPENVTATYLPNAQIGIKLHESKNVLGQKMLMVENPLRDLPFSPFETSRIQSLFSKSLLAHYSVTFLRGMVSKEDLVRNIQSMSSQKLGILHFVGHGEFYSEQPLESYLQLADSQLSVRDILEEIRLCNKESSHQVLVGLSACETGITNQVGLIDEFIGLNSAFLAAGAVSVVSSLWKVENLATALLMSKFYEILQHKLRLSSQLRSGDVANALRRSQVWLKTLSSEELANYLPLQQFASQLSDHREVDFYLRKALSRPHPFAEPYYWAGFIATGL